MNLLRIAALALLVSAAAPGCSGDEDEGPDLRCCDLVYPIWCSRFAECDPVTFSRSWRDAAACEAEHLGACRDGTDPEGVCGELTPSGTDACVNALGYADCADLFGAAGLPPECEP
jgi:hypothetical protein